MKESDRRVIISEKNFKKLQTRAEKEKISMKEVMEAFLKEAGF